MNAIGRSDHMHNHWWWRPGWRVGRSMYTWHVTFDNQPELHKLVNTYQNALAPLSGLDIIPLRWLHLTTQGIAFTDEIGQPEIASIAEAVRKRLDTQPPVTLAAASPAIVDPEAIMLEVDPADSLNPVRASIRAGIADVRGAAQVPEPEQWTPHISIAYSNSDGLAAPYIDALSSVPARPVSITVSAVQLIELNRDAHLYQWVREAEVPLSG